MADHPIRFCFERISPLEGALARSKKWDPGQILRVRFLDGEADVQARVIHYAMRWCEHANIHFVFGDDPDAEVRISFKYSGSWSSVGKDALLVPKIEATMNYGWLHSTCSDEEYSAVVLHEFGHALGMIHEHQSPAGGMRWNRPAVIADLMGPPNYWDRNTIRTNVFEKYAKTQTQFTQFDPKSIMLYSFPKYWTMDGQEFGWNTDLSEMDKAFIAQCYP